jgi:hypothetical protein
VKAEIKCFIILAIGLIASFCASASDTTTKFQTGPFTGSFDLGMSCTDLNMSKPEQGERISGERYTKYELLACGALIIFTRYDNPVNDLNEEFGTWSIQSDLLSDGAEKDSIILSERKIDNKPGAVGYGYVPRYEQTLYKAAYYVSPRTVCHIYVGNNESMIVSLMKTIHVTEAP